MAFKFNVERLDGVALCEGSDDAAMRVKLLMLDKEEPKCDLLVCGSNERNKDGI